MKKIFVTLTLLTMASSAYATGGLTCSSNDPKLRFDIVESSNQSPVSAKLFYKTDPVSGEDGSTQSFDLKNTKYKKTITYSGFNDELVVVFQVSNSVVSAKVNLETMNGKAQAMILDEAKTLNISCIRE